MEIAVLPQLIDLLKSDQTPELDGFFIVTFRLSRETTPVAEGLRWRRFPGGQRGAVVTHAFGDRTLQAVLLEPRGDGSPKNEGRSLAEEMPVAELCFSASDVETFVKETGDENPNHRGETAVVPGLLLARSVETTLRERAGFGDEFEFRFLESLPVNQLLFLIRETETRWAASRRAAVRWVGRSEAGRRVLEVHFPEPLA